MNWKGNITIYCDCGFINAMHTKERPAIEMLVIKCRNCGRFVTLESTDPSETQRLIAESEQTAHKRQSDEERRRIVMYEQYPTTRTCSLKAISAI